MNIFNKKHKQELSKKGYFNTRDQAWQFLIENNVTSYPLDLKGIINQNGWKVFDKQKYLLEHPELKKIIKKNEGYTFEANGQRIILVDSTSSIGRRRFTIGHEIGHIYLKHIGDDKNLIEREANMFSARILMPMVIIQELQLTTPQKLASFCNVSFQAAENRLKHFDEVKPRDKFYSSPLERQLYEQLKEFIQRSKAT